MKSFLFTVVFTFVSGSFAQAQHGDVLVYITGSTSGTGPAITGGKITTGLVDDGAPVMLGDNPLLGINVFGYDFGEDPLDPFVIGDPGFNNDAGPTVGIAPNNGVLPGSSVLGMNPFGILHYWNGVGAVNWSPAHLDVQLGINRGSTTGLISGTGIDVAFPIVDNIGASGRFHEHVTSELRYAGSVDDALPNAPNGIYYFGFTLSLSAGGVADSDPIYFVYNNGLSESQHDAAIASVQAIPEPGTYALLATCLVGGAIVGRRFRRRLPALA